MKETTKTYRKNKIKINSIHKERIALQLHELLLNVEKELEPYMFSFKILAEYQKVRLQHKNFQFRFHDLNCL